MKMKGLILVSALLLSNLAYANIIIRIPTATTLDVCSQLPGTWSGKGTIEKGVISCGYSGTVIVTSTANQSFNLDVSLSRASGTWPCPKTEELKNISATCDNGVIIVNESDANLNGSMSGDGRSASLSGTITFSGITANVKEMDLNKQ